MTTWPVRHPGIGVLHYATEQEAIVAAGTAGTILPPADSPVQLTIPAGVTSGTPKRRSCADARHRDAAAPIGSKCRPDCRAPAASQAHCSVCHRTFAGTTYFDKHRCNGWCHHPTEQGLTEVDGLWSTPEGHEKRAADAVRLAAARWAGRS